MSKQTRRKKTTVAPQRARARALAAKVTAAGPVGPVAPPKAARRRGRRRGLLNGLTTHEHERDILDQYLHEVSKTPLLTQKEEIALARTADLSRIVRTAEYLRQTLRREPTPEEIADATRLSLEVVQSLAALNTGDVRLDAPLDPDGDRSLIERFIAEDLPDTEERAMDRFLSDEIESALNTLQKRDAKVLRLYFGLDGGREHTLEEIGGMLGVTRERVRQLRDRALKRLRDGDVGKALASFAA